MKILLAIVGFMWVFPISTTVQGQDKPDTDTLLSELATCASRPGDLERLECYDILSRKLQVDAPRNIATDVEETGNWEVSTTLNPIDDTRRVILRLESSSGRGRSGEPISLVARCQSNKTEVYINWNHYLGDDSASVYESWKYVTIRIGASSAEMQQWSVSTSNDSTFAPNWAGDLLKEMVNADSFLAQTTPYGQSPVTAIFDIRGIRNALVPLMEICGWSL